MVGRYLAAPPPLDGSSLPSADTTRHDLLWKSWSGPGWRLRLSAAKPVYDREMLTIDLPIIAEGKPPIAGNGEIGTGLVENDLWLSVADQPGVAAIMSHVVTAPDRAFVSVSFPRPGSAGPYRISGGVMFGLVGRQRSEEIVLLAAPRAQIGPAILTRAEVEADETTVSLRSASSGAVAGTSPMADPSVHWLLVDDGIETTPISYSTQSYNGNTTWNITFPRQADKTTRLRRTVDEVSTERITIDARIEAP